MMQIILLIAHSSLIAYFFFLKNKDKNKTIQYFWDIFSFAFGSIVIFILILDSRYL